MKLKTVLATYLCAFLSVSAFAGSGYSYAAEPSNGLKVAQAAAVVNSVTTEIGQVLATPQGKTLYVFTKDRAAASVCYAACAASWPPFLAKKNAQPWGDFSVITRTDGTHQWAYKNQPLYTWVGDVNEGDISGHGINNVWYAAQESTN